MKKYLDVNTMTAAQINKELDKLDAESSKITDDLIAAGRGHELIQDALKELIQDALKRDDELSMRLRANVDRIGSLRNEISRRYGPKAPSRLPKGFGPIKSIYKR